MTFNASFRNIFELSRFELLGIVRSPRAIALILLYLMATGLGAVAYNSGRAQISIVTQGIAEEEGVAAGMAAGQSIEEQGKSFFKKALVWYVGSDEDELHPAAQSEAMWALTLMGILALLPWVMMLSGFDVVAQALRERHYCFYGLRASRAQFLISKWLAQWVLFAALSATAFVLVFIYAYLNLPEVDALIGLSFLARTWLILQAVGAFYAAVVIAASSLTKTPFFALSFSVMAFLSFRIFAWMPAFTDGPLRNLEWISPIRHGKAMFLDFSTDLAWAILYFVGMTVLLLNLIWLRFRGGDL